MANYQRVMVRPQFREAPDGTWVAFYPDHGWEVSAPTRELALQELKDEEARRSLDPAYRDWFAGQLQNPPASWLAEDMSAEDYEARMRELLADDN